MRKSLVVSGSILIVLGILMILTSQIETWEERTYPAWTYALEGGDPVRAMHGKSDFSVDLSPGTYRLWVRGGVVDEGMNSFSSRHWDPTSYIEVTDSQGNSLCKLDLLLLTKEDASCDIRISRPGNYRFTTFGMSDLAGFQVTIMRNPPPNIIYNYDHSYKPYALLFPIGLAVSVVGSVLFVVGLTPKRKLPSKPTLSRARALLFWVGLVILGFASFYLFNSLWALSYISPPSRWLKYGVPNIVYGTIFILIGLYMMKSGVKKKEE